MRYLPYYVVALLVIVLATIPIMNCPDLYRWPFILFENVQLTGRVSPMFLDSNIFRHTLLLFPFLVLVMAAAHRSRGGPSTTSEDPLQNSDFYLCLAGVSAAQQAVLMIVSVSLSRVVGVPYPSAINGLTGLMLGYNPYGTWLLTTLAPSLSNSANLVADFMFLLLLRASILAIVTLGMGSVVRRMGRPFGRTSIVLLSALAITLFLPPLLSTWISSVFLLPSHLRFLGWFCVLSLFALLWVLARDHSHRSATNRG